MTNFNYNRDIPNTPNNPSADQPNMKINTNNTDDLIAVDHLSFNTNNGGTHKQVQIQKQQTTVNGVIPAGLIGAGFDTIYCSTTAGVDELWFVRNALGTGIQLTGPGTPSKSSNGYTFLPGGLLIQWGQITDTSSSLTTVLFATNNINFPNNCYVVMTSIYGSATGAGGNGTVKIRKSSVSNTSFQYSWFTNSSEYSGFFWVAIGN